jgi:hypothetical protein
MPAYFPIRSMCSARFCPLSAVLGALLLIGLVGASPAIAQSGNIQWLTSPRDVQFALGEVLKTKDHRGLPFAIVDKKTAQLFVFDGAGQLQGSAPALLGLAPGDVEVTESVGADTQNLSAVRRTTPAGRFISEPGRNLSGEAIVWVDYAARLAIHRLRPAALSERRAERLASSTPDDNRITLGCVVVAPQFYDTVVAPVMGKGYGVVYVLPETEALQRLHASAH